MALTAKGEPYKGAQSLHGIYVDLAEYARANGISRATAKRRAISLAPASAAKIGSAWIIRIDKETP